MRPKHLSLALLTLLAACNENSKSHMAEPTPSGYVDSDTTYITLEEAGGDTLLVGTIDYSDTMVRLLRLQYNVDAVASPDMLLMLMETYDDELQACTTAAANIEDTHERQRADSLLTLIRSTYDTRLAANRFPDFVLQSTLRDLIAEVNACRTAEDLEALHQQRYTIFHHLNTLPTIVERGGDMRKIRILAHQLEQTYNRRRAQLRH